MTISVNNKTIKTFNFSGGECHVSIANTDIKNITEVEAYLYNSDDIMRLLMTVDAVKNVNADTKINLHIPYFPYARQDRVCNEGEAFSAKVMIDLINGLNCTSVTVIDPHSDIVAEHLQNCKVISQADVLKESLVEKVVHERKLILVSPDKGAFAKTKEVAQHLNADVLYCTKIRDTKTGQIIDSQVEGDVSGKDLIILDDICDGGRTFIELAKVLKEKGSSDLYLYVTHGIFSKGLDVLKEHFKHVYCYHSFLDENDLDTEFLTVMEGEGQ